MSSLYVHIPFCSHICSYCDFSKVFYKEDWADSYLDALNFEIKDKGIHQQFDTIYIGGGTPSALSISQMERLLEILKPFSHNVREYSIEVNPESMDNDKLDLIIKYGINRLSIGVQTFDDCKLKLIDRYHSSKEAIDLVSNAKKKGISDINIDLIYGLPTQTLEDVKRDIDVIKELDISHVSIYSLILEENTKLKNIDFKPLDEDDDAKWYDYINEELEYIGFHHYEVSNYYKTKPSLHNLVYWHYYDYEGVGLGAHSLKNHYRYENTRSLKKYIKCEYLKEKTFLNKEEEIFEKIMMGLRLVDGLNIQEINTLFHIDFIEKYNYVLNKYMNMGMLELKDGYLKTTKKGMKFLNAILVDFL